MRFMKSHYALTTAENAIWTRYWVWPGMNYGQREGVFSISCNSRSYGGVQYHDKDPSLELVDTKKNGWVGNQ